jgi:hypothetical protein
MINVIREKELDAVERQYRDAGLESRDKPGRVYILRLTLRDKVPEILIDSHSFITAVYLHENRRFPVLFTPARKVNAFHKHAPYFCIRFSNYV